MAASFIPRAVFPLEGLTLPRSYYLGHHASGLATMKTMLSSVDLIIECRDYRVPFTSRNPLFEQSLAGRERLVVYTKKDLGSQGKTADRKVGDGLVPPLDSEQKLTHLQREDFLTSWHKPSSVLFSDHKSKRDVRSILNFAKDYAVNVNSLTGSRMMVVGMPNVGKSSLINALRSAGVHRGKAASTGAQPGITRKIASGVKIVDADPEKDIDPVYLVDTPGVFIPFVPDPESMLKLACVGSVKDTIIPPTTLADYLLFHINQIAPSLYGEYSAPTNDVFALIAAICQKTGRLQKGGSPDIEAGALWMIQRWRQGHMGTFVLDEVTAENAARQSVNESAVSLAQAKKRRKDDLKARRQARAASTA